MKVTVDLNVLLDVAQNRLPHITRQRKSCIASAGENSPPCCLETP